MPDMKSVHTLLLAAILVTGAPAALVEKAVTYQQKGVVMEGFHVFDDTVVGKRPAIL